jgi:hypothetical protein
MSEILLVNPRRRRRSSKRRTSSRKRRRNPVANPRRRRRRAASHHKRRVSHRRRNPAPRLNLRTVQHQVMSAVPGAVGALGLDVLMGVVPLPDRFKGGLMGYGVKAVGAIALGMLAGMAGVKSATAAKMTEGALTVMIHGALRQGVGQFAPQIPLGAYPDEMLGYAGSGWNPNYDNSMGLYLPGADMSAPPADGNAGEYTYDWEAENYF